MSTHIKASEFKAKCLKLMDEIALSGEELIITKNGKPVAKLVPAEDPKKNRPSIIGLMEGQIRMKDWDDLERPVIDPNEWTGDEHNILGLHDEDDEFEPKK